MSAPAKAAIWFTFCNILQRGISMITVPIFTRILDTEEYGIFNVYLSWMNVLIIFTSLNLYYGVFNNSMLKYENDRDRYTSSMQGLVCTITIGTFLVYLVCHKQVNSFIGLSTHFMLFMFIEMLVSPALQFWSARQRFEFKYKLLVGITVFKSILNPVVGILAIVITKRGAMARVASMVAIECLICGSIMIYQFVKGNSFYNKEYWKYAIGFNLPLLPHYLSGTILNQGDRIMINAYVGTSEVAIYSVAHNVGMLMQLFTNAINSSFTPWFYTSMRDKKYADIKRVTNLLLLLMSVLVIGLMFFAPEVVKLFAPDEYYSAIYVVPPISASVYFIFMYVLFSNVEFYFEENKFIMIASIIAALLNVCLNAVFIPVYGFLAAGYTTLFSYGVYCFAHYIFSKIVCKKHIGLANLYDSKFILLLSLIVVSTTVLFNFLYGFFVIRYIIALFFGIIIVIKRNLIIDTIKTIRSR
nr:oligosaccharide flippase family protein [Ruminococcus sp.]